MKVYVDDSRLFVWNEVAAGIQPLKDFLKAGYRKALQIVPVHLQCLVDKRIWVVLVQSRVSVRMPLQGVQS